MQTLKHSILTAHEWASGSFAVPVKVCPPSKPGWDIPLVLLVRIEKAKELLPNPDLHVREIGHQIGFDSTARFSRVFKRLVGTTPTRYRRQVLS